MLVHRSAKADDLRVGAFEKAVEPALQGLGIDAVGQRGKADQVREQHGRRAQFRLQGRRLSRRFRPQARTATAAKALVGKVGEPASRAGRRQSRAAAAAKAPAIPILRLAAWTAHSVRRSPPTAAQISRRRGAGARKVGGPWPPPDASTTVLPRKSFDPGTSSMARPPRPSPGLIRTMEKALQDHRAGRLADAERGYLQVLSADPDNPEALHLLGVLAGSAGDHARAAELVRRSLRRKPTPEAHLHLGIALTALGDIPDAI